MAKKFIYIGKGAVFFGVPARDLTQADLDGYAELWAAYGITEEQLVKSGLYVPVETEPKKKTKRGPEAAKDGE